MTRWLATLRRHRVPIVGVISAIVAVLALVGGAHLAANSEWGYEQCVNEALARIRNEREAADIIVQADGWSWVPPGVRCRITVPEPSATEVRPPW